MGLQTLLATVAATLSAYLLLRDLLPGRGAAAGKSCGTCHGGCPAQAGRD